MTSKKRRPSGESGDPRKGTPREEADLDVVTAITKLVGHTGAKGFQVRFSDDEQPVVWIAVATYPSGAQVGAAFTPGQAAWRLGEQLIDGGHCTHCGRPTALLMGEDPLVAPDVIIPETMGGFCEYRYRNANIVRGCDSMPVGTPK